MNRLPSSTHLLKIKTDLFSKDSETLTQKYYQTILAHDLILKQNYTSVMQLPRVDQIILNTTSKNYTSDKKLILFTLLALELISGQRPQLTYARKSIANFKTRQHQILGCKVVLGHFEMYNFLEKLSRIIFPRIRDYKKKKSNSSVLYDIEIKKNHRNSQKFSLNYGFQNLMIFPELENNYELVESFRGLNLTFILKNSNNKTAPLLLTGFQIPVF